jgi:hypothetical protein
MVGDRSDVSNTVRTRKEGMTSVEEKRKLPSCCETISRLSW